MTPVAAEIDLNTRLYQKRQRIGSVYALGLSAVGYSPYPLKIP